METPQNGFTRGEMIAGANASGFQLRFSDGHIYTPPKPVPGFTVCIDTSTLRHPLVPAQFKGGPEWSIQQLQELENMDLDWWEGRRLEAPLLPGEHRAPALRVVP